VGQLHLNRFNCATQPLILTNVTTEAGFTKWILVFYAISKDFKYFWC